MSRIEAEERQTAQAEIARLTGAQQVRSGSRNSSAGSSNSFGATIVGLLPCCSKSHRLREMRAASWQLCLRIRTLVLPRQLYVCMRAVRHHHTPDDQPDPAAGLLTCTAPMWAAQEQPGALLPQLTALEGLTCRLCMCPRTSSAGGMVAPRWGTQSCWKTPPPVRVLTLYAGQVFEAMLSLIRFRTPQKFTSLRGFLLPTARTAGADVCVGCQPCCCEWCASSGRHQAGNIRHTGHSRWVCRADSFSFSCTKICILLW